MSDMARLQRAFAAGELVNPAGPGPKLPDFSRALYTLAGATGADLTAEARGLMKLIGPAEHYVLVLLDGLGEEMLSRAPAGGFLRTHHAATLTTVYPATTAAALTALATGEYPGQHAVPGWWVWLEPPGVSAEVLPFVERFGRKPLPEFGVRPEEVFTIPSAVARLGHEPLAVMPAEIAESIYTRYCTGNTPRKGYEKLDAAFNNVIERVMAADGPSFTYLYIPHLDAACHDHGVTSEPAMKLLALLDNLLGGLASKLAGRARIALTGDHGLVDIPPERSLYLDEGDPLLDHLRHVPNGESTAMFFDTKPGRAEAFAAEFRARYGEHFGLLSTGEVEELRFFGPEPLSPLARGRIGDFIAFAWRPAALYYRPREGKIHVHRGAHAGLTPAEMRIPLVLA